MNRIELKVPPLAVFFITCVLMWVVAKINSFASFDHPYQFTTILILFNLGLLLGVGALVSFFRKKTTIDPLAPTKASKLIDSGFYQLSRNPMYLALLFETIAWASYLSNILGFIMILIFPLYMNKFQIIPEEKALTDIFGDDYRQYQVKVRRWL